MKAEPPVATGAVLKCSEVGTPTEIAKADIRGTWTWWGSFSGTRKNREGLPTSVGWLKRDLVDGPIRSGVCLGRLGS